MAYCACCGVAEEVYLTKGHDRECIWWEDSMGEEVEMSKYQDATSQQFADEASRLLEEHGELIIQASLSRCGGLKNARVIRAQEELREVFGSSYYMRPQAIIEFFKAESVGQGIMYADGEYSNELVYVENIIEGPISGFYKEPEHLFLKGLVPDQEGNLVPGAY